MTDQIEILVPPHLQELVEPTPSGTAKLIAAWDGLTAESQMLMLTAKKKHPGPAYLYNRIIEKALTSENAFVRYMVAREIHCRDNWEKNLIKQVENDPEPLVKYAHLENPFVVVAGPERSELEDPEKFFALPHEARLAKVRRLADGGTLFANLISHAVDHHLKDGRISQLEIFEILADYLNQPEFKARHVDYIPSYDGYGAFLVGQKLETLWQLVLTVPENISYILIEHLPEGAGLSIELPKQVLDGMTDHQLVTLLSRPDIDLKELRKQKFFEPRQDDDEHTSHNSLRSVAISHNFDLTNEEFGAVLAKSDRELYRDLSDLVWAKDLRLCLFDAIGNVMKVSEHGNSLWSSGGHIDDARRAFQHKLEGLKDWQRERELRELKLYRLAVQAVPWDKKKEGYPPSGELASLQAAVVEGDTWATFMAFSEKWHPQWKRLEKHLPKIPEAGENEVNPIEAEDIDDTKRLADRVANKLSDLLAAARGELEDKIAGAFGEASAHATVAQKTSEAVASMEAELAALKNAHSRQRILSWVEIGLLAVLLLVNW
ncbi:MAG: hypothetical protein U1E42_11705 [Rhodospirillales bacterium]